MNWETRYILFIVAQVIVIIAMLTAIIVLTTN